MPRSYYLDNNIANLVLRNTAFTPPVQTYLALFTAAPTPAGGGTEVSGGSYSRQPVTWTAPVNGQCANSIDVIFAIATASWGTVTHFALFDAASGGNMLYFNNMSAAMLIDINGQPKFYTGQLIITES